jgi:hypothetical protein
METMRKIILALGFSLDEKDKIFADLLWKTGAEPQAFGISAPHHPRWSGLNPPEPFQAS